MAPGDLVLRAGRRIGAAELSVLATLGVTAVEVYLRPAVAIVSTGDELVDATRAPATGQVRDSNRWAIAGGLAALGCQVVHLPRAVDEVAAIRAGIAEGLRVADAVVLTGGSSVGARDHVPAAIDGLGAPGVVVHGLRVKPGKPTVLAAVGARPVIGLPGNPTSALTILDAIASDVFRALTGEARPAGQPSPPSRPSRSPGGPAGRGTSRRCSTARPRGRWCCARRTPACWPAPTATWWSGRTARTIEAGEPVTARTLRRGTARSSPRRSRRRSRFRRLRRRLARQQAPAVQHQRGNDGAAAMR